MATSFRNIVQNNNKKPTQQQHHHQHQQKFNTPAIQAPQLFPVKSLQSSTTSSTSTSTSNNEPNFFVLDDDLLVSALDEFENNTSSNDKHNANNNTNTNNNTFNENANKQQTNPSPLFGKKPFPFAQTNTNTNTSFPPAKPNQTFSHNNTHNSFKHNVNSNNNNNNGSNNVNNNNNNGNNRNTINSYFSTTSSSSSTTTFNSHNTNNTNHNANSRPSFNPPRSPPMRNAPLFGRGRGRGYASNRGNAKANKGKKPTQKGDNSGEEEHEQERTPKKRKESPLKNYYSVDAGPVSFPNEEEDEPPTPDMENIKTWVYPTNYPRRDYQFSIVQKCLYHNTLVCLPTGLGKTFIAAVVMFNFYHWFPHGKVVFMAPTKPLVSQQIEACHDVMGIPQSDTMEMTGHTPVSTRGQLWERKRVFFLTPQVLANDISTGLCPAKSIVCVVVDEAHRAQGSYAYCPVIKGIAAQTRHFRVLALSATPGPDIKSIQSVINNLLISNMEIRTDDAIDVRQYIHSRQIENVVVPLTSCQLKVKTMFEKILKKPIDRLVNMQAFYQRDVDKISQYQLLHSRELYRKNPTNPRRGVSLEIESQFSLAVSLYSAYSVLKTHGLLVFKEKILSFGEDKDKQITRSRKSLINSDEWKQFFKVLKEAEGVGENHNKLNKLKEIVVNHFDQHRNQDTRVMVFVQWRDSVNEIVQLLNPIRTVKVMSFVGQSNGKNSKGLTQKEQAKIIKEFRAGGYNTLVATCIGEEGLDIGEVDLIVCFDAQQSPTRMIQRMGRTGRKRTGRCVMLLTEGSEELLYKASLEKKRSIYAIIAEKRNEVFKFFDQNPRMIPPSIRPEVVNQAMDIKPYQKLFDKKPRASRKKLFDDEEKELITSEELFYLHSNYGVDYSSTTFNLPPSIDFDFSVHSNSFPTPVHKIPHSKHSRVLMQTSQFISDIQDSLTLSSYESKVSRLYPEVENLSNDDVLSDLVSEKDLKSKTSKKGAKSKKAKSVVEDMDDEDLLAPWLSTSNRPHTNNTDSEDDVFMVKKKTPSKRSIPSPTHEETLDDLENDTPPGEFEEDNELEHFEDFDWTVHLHDFNDANDLDDMNNFYEANGASDLNDFNDFNDFNNVNDLSESKEENVKNDPKSPVIDNGGDFECASDLDEYFPQLTPPSQSTSNNTEDIDDLSPKMEKSLYVSPEPMKQESEENKFPNSIPPPPRKPQSSQENLLDKLDKTRDTPPKIEEIQDKTKFEEDKHSPSPQTPRTPTLIKTTINISPNISPISISSDLCDKNSPTVHNLEKSIETPIFVKPPPKAVSKQEPICVDTPSPTSSKKIKFQQEPVVSKQPTTTTIDDNIGFETPSKSPVQLKRLHKNTTPTKKPTPNSNPHSNTITKKHKKISKSEFVENEADCGDEDEEEECDEDEDVSLNSFIIDESGTESDHTPVNMRSIYARSLLSQMSPTLKFKHSARKARPNAFKMVFKTSTPDTSIDCGEPEDLLFPDSDSETDEEKENQLLPLKKPNGNEKKEKEEKEPTNTTTSPQVVTSPFFGQKTTTQIQTPPSSPPLITKKKSQKRLFPSPDQSTQQQNEKVDLDGDNLHDKSKTTKTSQSVPSKSVSEEDVPSFNIFGSFDFDEKNSPSEQQQQHNESNHSSNNKTDTHKKKQQEDDFDESFELATPSSFKKRVTLSQLSNDSNSPPKKKSKDPPTPTLKNQKNNNNNNKIILSFDFEAIDEQTLAELDM